MSYIYEIDISTSEVEEDVTITGYDLLALKGCILPIVKSICETKKYKGDSVYLTTNISENGEYFDHDEDEIILSEI